jgi:hypothetical protein
VDLVIRNARLRHRPDPVDIGIAAGRRSIAGLDGLKEAWS